MSKKPLPREYEIAQEIYERRASDKSTRRTTKRAPSTRAQQIEAINEQVDNYQGKIQPVYRGFQVRNPTANAG